jgi:hypothetical protein
MKRLAAALLLCAALSGCALDIPGLWLDSAQSDCNNNQQSVGGRQSCYSGADREYRTLQRSWR